MRHQAGERVEFSGNPQAEPEQIEKTSGNFREKSEKSLGIRAISREIIRFYLRVPRENRSHADPRRCSDKLMSGGTQPRSYFPNKL